MGISPFVLQFLANQALRQFGSTANDFPAGSVSPWGGPAAQPSPVEPVMQMPEFDEEGARRRAGRVGLGAAGIALLAGAGRGDYAGSMAEALAAMAATRRQRYDDERNQFRQEEQGRIARETYDRQNRLTQAQIDNYEADNQRAGEAAAAQAEARQQEISRQQEIVSALPPSEQRDRLARLVGAPPDDFRKYYWEITAPPKPQEPDRMQVQGDVLEFPEAGGPPRVVYSAPPEPSSRMSTEDAVARAVAIADAVETVRQRHGKSVPSQEQFHDDIAAEEKRLWDDWLKTRMEGVGKEVPPEVEYELRKKGHKGIALKKGPNEMYMYLKDGTKVTEAEFYRRKIRRMAEETVRKRHQAAREQRSNTIIDIDAYGNEIP